jgi:hypothetical protein
MPGPEVGADRVVAGRVGVHPVDLDQPHVHAVVVLPRHDHHVVVVEAQHRELARHRVGTRVGVGVDRVQVGDHPLDGDAVEPGEHVLACDGVAVGDQSRVDAAADRPRGDARRHPPRRRWRDLLPVIEDLEPCRAGRVGVDHEPVPTPGRAAAQQG